MARSSTVIRSKVLDASSAGDAGRKGQWLPGVTLIAALVAMVSIGWLSVRQAHLQGESANLVTHTHEVIEQLQLIPAGVAQAESSLRGFAIVREQSFKQEIDPARERTRRAISRVRNLLHDNEDQLFHLKQVEEAVDRRFSLIDDRAQKLSAGAPPDIHPEAHALTIHINTEVEEMLAVERRLLEVRAEETRDDTHNAVTFAGVATLTSTLLILMTLTLLSRELRRRHSAEAEVSLMLRFSELLQACRTSEEAQDVACRLAPRFFEGTAGAVATVHPSRDSAEVRGTWGGQPGEVGETFLPDDCWALRRGQPYAFESGSGDPPCIHLGGQPRAGLCVPLVALGELVGVLSLVGNHRVDDGIRRRAATVGEQLGMALGNLRIRETLRNQSIRDPLTGLFNRRYAEETLERELRRAERDGGKVGVIAIDVDHFKRINDTFGHDGGDVVLREIAKLMRVHTRGGDVASRMGGEELLVLLPGADIEATRSKAERLRSAVARLDAMHHGRSLGGVTISLGVAVYPENAADAEALLRAADTALYRAKNEGRDRVSVAEQRSVPPPSLRPKESN